MAIASSYNISSQASNGIFPHFPLELKISPATSLDRRRNANLLEHLVGVKGRLKGHVREKTFDRKFSFTCRSDCHDTRSQGQHSSRMLVGGAVVRKVAAYSTPVEHTGVRHARW